MKGSKKKEKREGRKRVGGCDSLRRYWTVLNSRLVLCQHLAPGLDVHLVSVLDHLAKVDVLEGELGEELGHAAVVVCVRTRWVGSVWRREGEARVREGDADRA